MEATQKSKSCWHVLGNIASFMYTLPKIDYYPYLQKQAVCLDEITSLLRCNLDSNSDRFSFKSKAKKIEERADSIVEQVLSTVVSQDKTRLDSHKREIIHLFRAMEDLIDQVYDMFPILEDADWNQIPEPVLRMCDHIFEASQILIDAFALLDKPSITITNIESIKHYQRLVNTLERHSDKLLESSLQSLRSFIKGHASLSGTTFIAYCDLRDALRTGEDVLDKAQNVGDALGIIAERGGI